MNGGRLKQGPLVVLAALILGALIGQVAVARQSATAGNAKAQISISKKKLKKLIRREVAKRITPGPAGPAGQPGAPGAPGSPPCQGNGSGDAMVAAGAVCIDKYEVSVWSSPTGGTPYGVSSDDYGMAGCSDNGQDCTDIYARSVPGVTPSRFITYFQAQAALANVGKRLPSNAEWQQAVAGTPDTGGADIGPPDCNTDSTFTVADTGSRSACVSNFGAMDMVGNLYEWVGDWVPLSKECTPALYGGDLNCLGGTDETAGPGALIRSGSFADGSEAGPFTVGGVSQPSDSGSSAGFRGAR